MTLTYGFYDSLNGDRTYNADQMSRMFEGIITEGIFQSIGGGFVVTPNSGMLLNVATGRAWFANTWTKSDANFIVAILASEPVLPRIDTVVLEVNKDLATRANTIKVIKGTPNSSPVAPTLSNTATLIQKGLADVYVGPGVTSINAGNITNRVGTAGTPFITGVLTSFDVATLFGQFESNFEAWFANLQNQLDANQASNLQNQINDLYLQNNKGWMAAAGSWSYAGSTTFNVTPDATLTYQKKDKVRWKQGGAYKYGHVLNVTTGQIGLIPTDDYSIVNAAVTDVWFSREDRPFGFPLKFNYTPTFGASGNAAVPTMSTTYCYYTHDLTLFTYAGTITNINGGVGSLTISTPWTFGAAAGTGRENAVTGSMLQIQAQTTKIVLITYNNGGFMTNGWSPIISVTLDMT